MALISKLLRLSLLAPAMLAIGAPAQQAPQPVPSPEPIAPEQGAPQQAVAQPQRVPVYTLDIVARYPHDARAFTQGLLWHDGHLYESTGKEGRSEVRRVSLADGRVLARRAIPADQFGEGLALWRSHLISLTWHGGVAYRWDLASLRPRGTLRYTGEGWGLASGPDGLLLSDGTDTIRTLDPESFAERRRIRVTVAGRPLDQLNELEMVDGELFANVWRTDFIVAIDPASGAVTKIIDAGALSREVGARDTDAVLNGIAWDAKARRLFVTGKLWPTLFEVKLRPM